MYCASGVIGVVVGDFPLHSREPEILLIEATPLKLCLVAQVANILPKGAYVEQAVKVAKKELALECDYRNELVAQARFKKLIEGTCGR